LAFNGEYLLVVGFFALLLLQLEQAVVDNLAKGVLVEFTYWHLAVVLLVLSAFKHILEHVLLVTTGHSLLEVFLFFDALFLLLSVELNLLLEFFILLALFTLGVGLHLLDLGAALHHLEEGVAALSSPELLGIFSLLENDLFNRVVSLEFVSQNL
jgi:hypothetical protein